MDQESAWIERTLAGEKEAFRELVRLHQARVRAYLAQTIQDMHTVDDLAQESFIQAYRKLGSYRGEAAFSSWLIGIAKHRMLDWLRRQARRRKHEAGPLEGALAAWRVEQLEAPAAEPVTADRQITALTACLDRLPSSRARLVRSHYFEGTPTDDMAEQFGKTGPAVRMALMRIRRSLRRCIEKRLALEVA